MDKAVKEKWLKALRSGEYKQCKYQLRSRDNGFCCLGVLCNLHAQAHPEIAEKQESIHNYMGEATLPHKEVLKWAGIPVGYGGNSVDVIVTYKHETVSLAQLNDDYGLSFKQIANVIERCL